MGVGVGGACMHFLDRFFGGSDLPRFGKGGGGGGVGGQGLVSEFWGMCFLHKTPS